MKPKKNRLTNRSLQHVPDLKSPCMKCVPKSKIKSKVCSRPLMSNAQRIDEKRDSNTKMPFAAHSLLLCNTLIEEINRVLSACNVKLMLTVGYDVVMA